MHFHVVKMAVTLSFLTTSSLLNPAVASECDHRAELDEHADLRAARI